VPAYDPPDIIGGDVGDDPQPRKGGHKKPEWNNGCDEGGNVAAAVTSSTNEHSSRPPRRNSREGKRQPLKGKESQTWRHKHTRPEWIDSWENGGAGSAHLSDVDSSMDVDDRRASSSFTDSRKNLPGPKPQLSLLKVR